jgi:hypothetical protein
MTTYNNSLFTIIEGIPVAYRPLVWTRISLANTHKQRFPTDYYQRLLHHSIQEDGLEKNVADDIEKDVDRTFPDHEYFSTGNF